jgi:hypothetical protein
MNVTEEVKRLRRLKEINLQPSPKWSRQLRVVRIYVDDVVQQDNERTYVQQFGEFDFIGFMECLRHANAIDIQRNDSDGICFDVLPPGVVDDTNWANLEAARFKSYGFNAVSAPSVERKAWICSSCGSRLRDRDDYCCPGTIEEQIGTPGDVDV